MADKQRKRHIRKRPEECPEPAILPETEVHKSAEQQCMPEAPCITPHEKPSKEKPPAEYQHPEEDNI